MPVAGLQQRREFASRNFVRRAIAATLLVKAQWTVIRHKVLGEECFWRAKTLRKQAPQALAAHFRALALESLHRPLRMLPVWLADRCSDLQPIANRRNFAKRQTRLRHSIWPGILAEENQPILCSCVSS